MLTHPFVQSNWGKILWITVGLLLATVIWVFLVVYGDIPVYTAIADSLFYTVLLAIVGYFYWYIMAFFQVFQAQVVFALSVQFVCLGATFMLLSLIELEDSELFMNTIPLRLFAGLFSWSILLQWYYGQRIKLISEGNNDTKNKCIMNAAYDMQEQSKDNEPEETILSRISVKDNSKIHIIKIEDLLYIQAYGDYVMLFTSTGKYVKELTMKYLEANLPSSFIRIHRSYIVNTDFIVRVELFSKETYQVRLKNGEYLRVSNSGYKLLKSKLLL